MKDISPCEEIIPEHASDRLKDPTRLSILSWNAGLKNGKVTNSVVGSYHVILLQKQRDAWTISQKLQRNSFASAKAQISSFFSTGTPSSLTA